MLHLIFLVGRMCVKIMLTNIADRPTILNEIIFATWSIKKI